MGLLKIGLIVTSIKGGVLYDRTITCYSLDTTTHCLLQLSEAYHSSHPKPCLCPVIRTSCVFESCRATIGLPLRIIIPGSYVLLLSYKYMKPFAKSLFLEKKRSTSCRSSSDPHTTLHMGFFSG